MTISTPQPQPAAPPYVSATLLATYRACPLRAAYGADPRWRHLRRSGLRAALGTAAHAVAARAGTGATFNEVWGQETTKARTNLAQEWAPATPPAVNNWPGAALTKAKLAKGWTSGVTQPGSTAPTSPSKEMWPHKASAGLHPPLPWRERWLHPDGSGLAGRPDLVEHTDHLRVVDLKTGVWQRAMTGAQRTQLLFYCRLVQLALGELPARASVRTADGKEDEIKVREEEVLEVESAALQVLHDLQAAAHGATLEGRPAEDTCATCPFRVACGPFLEAYQPDWRCGAVRAGALVSVPTPGASPPLAEADVLLPAWATGRMRLVGLPIPNDAQPGEIWAFSDFEGHRGTAMARWNTVVAPWVEADADWSDDARDAVVPSPG
ncbi:PD-(D/E)XK nuclease family protein [Cellulomonas sp. Root485]|uniref:PD-(D/E)XK nuclease family protein n=1 Tax=Cellulomonas sp. Root485 TaxID=1736546 RepID=UPI0009E8586E|nr:PD-(D/E)XK nuclease family protein [Cellulomonas sp. Root485]